jgi:hypothetical protein
MDFILGNPDIRIDVTPLRSDGAYSFYETYAIRSPTSCTVAWSDLWIQSKSAVGRLNYIVHLSAMDPNTIVAKPSPISGIGSFVVEMTPRLGVPQGDRPQVTNFVDVGTGLPSIDPPKGGANVADWQMDKQAIISAAKVMACPTGEKRCVSGALSPPSTTFFVGEQQLAVRYANAFKHAAILCGAKSATAF